MRWGKFILFFQAIVTLIIGIIFFVQVFNVQYDFESTAKKTVTQEGIESQIIQNELTLYKQFQKRFFSASYILVIISLMEIIIIWRLFDSESY